MEWTEAPVAAAFLFETGVPVDEGDEVGLSDDPVYDVFRYSGGQGNLNRRPVDLCAVRKHSFS